MIVICVRRTLYSRPQCKNYYVLTVLPTTNYYVRNPRFQLWVEQEEEEELKRSIKRKRSGNDDIRERAFRSLHRGLAMTATLHSRE